MCSELCVVMIRLSILYHVLEVIKYIALCVSVFLI
jgi:hypothetical protein